MSSHLEHTIHLSSPLPEVGDYADATYSSGEKSGIIEDYSIILERHGLAFQRIDYYLQVGGSPKQHGWILHVSVVRTQVPDVLECILPWLRNTPFTVVKNKETARCLLDGNLGPAMVGKIIRIFPTTDSDAVQLAQKLIEATSNFQGPSILTDVHLGGLVYTSYLRRKPVNPLERTTKEHEDNFNKIQPLLEDVAGIPFRMPEGIDWPFFGVAHPTVCKPKKVLKGKYLPVKLLKADTKGDVTKALYVNGSLRLKWCVVKQGRRNMWADEAGRDMRDRLAWQKEFHDRMGALVSMPKVVDLFEENGDAYLVQEYIQSYSLMDKLYSMNKDCRSWQSWRKTEKIEVANYLLEVLQIAAQIHTKGYVHRDLTPVNFLVRPNGKLVLIDSELAYDLNSLPSYLPFIAGTAGFMSPEQSAVKTPTVAEDIYALGAFLMTVLTGLAPLTFGTRHLSILRKKLFFFVRDESICELIAICLDPNPLRRPRLETLQATLQTYTSKVRASDPGEKISGNSLPIDMSLLRNTIEKGISGLVEEPMQIHGRLWLSRVSATGDILGKVRNQFRVMQGVYEGITGVLYFLARAKEAGFDISSCQQSYEEGWNYIEQSWSLRIRELPVGLYEGTAGIALALAKGIDVGLLEDSMENRSRIEQCLVMPNEALNLATGIAGQGAAAIQCVKYLDKDIYSDLLKGYVDLLINNQHRNNYWIFQKNRFGQPVNSLSFSYGNTGIIWFLLVYNEKAQDIRIQHLLVNSLATMLKAAKKLIRQINKSGVRKLVNGNIKIWDGLQGLVLIFIKAYETLGERAYAKIVEELLELYPATMVHDNLFQDTGLCGLGELHLEAFRVFKNPVFKAKSDWLINYFLHIRQLGEKDTVHWSGNNADFPTADLMTGNSGILHFLLRALPDVSIGYRLLV